MRISLIHYSAPPIVGGVESVIGHHARLMAAAGHQVRVVAGRGSSFDRRIQFTSVPLIDSRHSSVLDQKAQLDKGIVPSSFAHLVAQIKERLEPIHSSSDVLIAHNVCSLHKNLALSAALHEISQSSGAPHFILWQHDLAATSGRYEGELHASYPWDLLSKPWQGVKLVTISEARRQELAKLLGVSAASISIVPNGIDAAAQLKLGLSVRQISQKLNLMQAAPLLLLPVRLTRRKNIELALRVLAELRHYMPDARLVITGPVGAHNPENLSYFEELKSLRSQLAVDETVHFLAEYAPDGLTNESVADLYRMSDALFLPSWEEGFGIPILEAGLAGLPIFASSISTLQELARKDASFFAPDSSPDQVALLISDRLQNDPVYRQKTRIRNGFSWDAIYSRHIAPLLEVKHGT